MDRQKPPFKYALTALLRKDQWEGDVLAQEALRARQAADARRAVHAETLERIAAAQREMLEMYRPDATLSLERRQIIDMFLRHQEELAKQQAADVEKAQRVLDEISTQLTARRLSAKTLERHRDRLAREHEQDEVRLQAKAGDEAWLVHSRRRTQ